MTFKKHENILRGTQKYPYGMMGEDQESGRKQTNKQK